MKLQDMPSMERPYEKCELHGVKSLSNAELLSVLVQSGTRKQSGLELAGRLLAKSDGLPHLSTYSLEQWQSYPGIGRTKAIRLQAAFELGYRAQYRKAHEIHPSIRTAEEAIGYLREYGDGEKEIFRVLLLDTRCRLIRQVEIATGGLNSAAFLPRDVFREAVKANAHAVILCHNHPSGDSSPSKQDIQSSQALIRAGQLIGIQVLDHVIVSTGGAVSLREQGYLD